jgi:hypothetical protein
MEQQIQSLHNSNSNNKGNSIPTSTSESITVLDIEKSIAQSPFKQTYFKFLGKTRRLPDSEGVCGIVTTFLLFLIGTIMYESVCFSIVKRDNNTSTFKISKKPFLVCGIIGIITYIISQISYFDITTSIPGYQITNKMSEEEYKKSPPVKEYKGVKFVLKYCPTCKIARDIRTFHCRYCNMCIERHDHHCGYVSNCIGKNNTKKFFYFLIAACVHCLLVVGMCFYTFISVYIEINMLDQNNEVGFYTVICGVLIIFVGFFLIFIITMICTHVSLISKNQTTNEEIRKKYNNSIFDKGTRENCKEVFCVQEDVFIPEEWQLEKGELIIK